MPSAIRSESHQTQLPYVHATIELDEGVRTLCDLLDLEPENVAIDPRVEVGFSALPGQGDTSVEGSD